MKKLVILGLILFLLLGCLQGERDLCQEDSDCDDGLEETVDVCEGTPKECVNRPPTCEELGGVICKTGETCFGGTLNAYDTNVCCSYKCRVAKVDPCINVVCQENEKCVNGSCVGLTCEELGGIDCREPKTCTTPYLSAADTTTCCTGICELEADPCENVKCFGDEHCIQGICVLKNCEDLGGFLCEQNYLCKGSIIPAGDTADHCCNIPCELTDIDFSVLEIQFDHEKNVCGDTDGAYLSFLYNLEAIENYVGSVEYSILYDGEELEKRTFEKNVIEPGKRLEYFPVDKSINKHEIGIILDPENKIGEQTEENNRFSKKFKGDQTDLYFATTGGKPLFYDGEHIQVRIERMPPNIIECVPYKVNIYVNNKMIGVIHPALTNYTDKVAEGKIYHFFPKTDTYKLKAVIDPDKKVEETNESNNEYEVEIKVYI